MKRTVYYVEVILSGFYAVHTGDTWGNWINYSVCVDSGVCNPTMAILKTGKALVRTGAIER